MSRPIFPVILAGGAGHRLWPLSRELLPKQFIALVEGRTLLQATVQRLEVLDCAQPPIVVCNDDHRFMVAEQLRAIEVTPAAILLEPEPRNTAPAAAAAALEALARCGGSEESVPEEPILLVLPADHVIRGDERFAHAVREAVREAAAGRLVTFGVVPSRPETGFGYIRAGRTTGGAGEARVVERFVEKPDIHAAAAFIEAGGHYWNAGMFAFGASRYLHELGVHRPAVVQAVASAHVNAVQDRDFLRLDAESFARAPAVSVDRAVMEHASNAAVVPLGAAWSDVGSWAALFDLAERDQSGNAVTGDVILEGTENTYVRGDDRLVAAVGVSDLVIVDTADAVLVAHRNAAQALREVVARLRSTGRDEHRHHRRVDRPWGSFDSVYGGSGFRIKHLTVNPAQRLSLQVHRHRAEHWFVVCGTAGVTRGEETFTVTANQSTYIPKGVRHRLENPGNVPLELVEVQIGSYLGEDDIVRFEDTYGRAGPGAPDSPRLQSGDESGPPRSGSAARNGPSG